MELNFKLPTYSLLPSIWGNSIAHFKAMRYENTDRGKIGHFLIGLATLIPGIGLIEWAVVKSLGDTRQVDAGLTLKDYKLSSQNWLKFFVQNEESLVRISKHATSSTTKVNIFGSQLRTLLPRDLGVARLLCQYAGEIKRLSAPDFEKLPSRIKTALENIRKSEPSFMDKLKTATALSPSDEISKEEWALCEKNGVEFLSSMGNLVAVRLTDVMEGRLEAYRLLPKEIDLLRLLFLYKADINALDLNKSDFSPEVYYLFSLCKDKNFDNNIRYRLETAEDEAPAISYTDSRLAHLLGQMNSCLNKEKHNNIPEILETFINSPKEMEAQFKTDCLRLNIKALLNDREVFSLQTQENMGPENQNKVFADKRQATESVLKNDALWTDLIMGLCTQTIANCVGLPLGLKARDLNLAMGKNYKQLSLEKVAFQTIADPNNPKQIAKMHVEATVLDSITDQDRNSLRAKDRITSEGVISFDVMRVKEENGQDRWKVCDVSIDYKKPEIVRDGDVPLPPPPN